MVQTFTPAHGSQQNALTSRGQCAAQRQYRWAECPQPGRPPGQHPDPGPGDLQLGCRQRRRLLHPGSHPARQPGAGILGDPRDRLQRRQLQPGPYPQPERRLQLAGAHLRQRHRQRPLEQQRQLHPQPACPQCPQPGRPPGHDRDPGPGELHLERGQRRRLLHPAGHPARQPGAGILGDPGDRLQRRQLQPGPQPEPER